MFKVKLKAWRWYNEINYEQWIESIWKWLWSYDGSGLMCHLSSRGKASANSCLVRSYIWILYTKSEDILNLPKKSSFLIETQVYDFYSDLVEVVVIRCKIDQDSSNITLTCNIDLRFHANRSTRWKDFPNIWHGCTTYFVVMMQMSICA